MQLIHRLGLIGASSVLVAASVMAPAYAGVASCDTWTSDGRAWMSCNIKSGQFRVRADCKYYPDLYSPWRGVGYWVDRTGKCPFGIRGAILEGR
jgi:hypothetical protein